MQGRDLRLPGHQIHRERDGLSNMYVCMYVCIQAVTNIETDMTKKREEKAIMHYTHARAHPRSVS